MNIPTLDQLKRALHLSETIERLQAEMSAIFGRKIPKLAKEARATVMDFYGVGAKARKRPRFSKAAREAIAAGQRKRWAKKKSKAPKPAAKAVKPKGRARKKGKMSAAGRANIVAAQRARWAKVRAEKAKQG